MPSLGELASALYGAWRLMRFDKGGMAWFDVSIAGFWRSFLAAAIVAPFYAVLIALELGARGDAFDAGWAGVVSAAAYVATWAAFPIAAIFITRLLALSRRYVPLIVAYNWANVAQTLVYVPVILIAASGAVPDAAAQTLVVAATLYVLAYQWFVTRTALETTPLTATGVVILQVAIDILIHQGANSLI